MNCKNCKKEVHYCSSCGYEPYLMLGFCCRKCTEEYYTSHSEEPSLKQLAGIIYHFEDGTPILFHDKINKFKTEIGLLLIDRLLEGEYIDYD